MWKKVSPTNVPYLICTPLVLRESENSGLDHWTGQYGKGIHCNNPAQFIFKVMEPKFKFWEFRSKVPKQSCECQRFRWPWKWTVYPHSSFSCSFREFSFLTIFIHGIQYLSIFRKLIGSCYASFAWIEQVRKTNETEINIECVLHWYGFLVGISPPEPVYIR